MRSDIISSASDIITWAERTAPAAMPAPRDYEASTPEPPSVTFTPIRRGDVPLAWPWQAHRGLSSPTHPPPQPWCQWHPQALRWDGRGGQGARQGPPCGKSLGSALTETVRHHNQSSSQAISEQHYTASDSSPLENNDKLWWLMKEKKSTKPVCKRGVQYCYLSKNIIGASFW